MLIHVMTFGLFYGHFCIVYNDLVYFVVIWYIFPRFGMLYQVKSGNPELEPHSETGRNFA
jgi:hypothetical protein